MGFFRSSGDDDPGTIQSIEKASASRAKKSRPPTLRDIPRLTKDMMMQNSNSTSLKEAQEKATLAAKKLYELCGVGRNANREVMVSSGEYDVIGPLTQCLLHEPIYEVVIDSNTQKKNSSSTIVEIPHQQPKMEDDSINNNNTSIKTEQEDDDKDLANGETCSGDGDKEPTPIKSASSPTSTTETKLPTAKNNQRTVRTKKKRMDEKLHFVCLTLNNLSIPLENKRVMVMERGAKRLIGNLCKVIASGKKESHLCCIILMNLSFYEPGLTIIGQFSPRPKSSPIDDDRENQNGSSSSGTAKKALKTTTTILKRAATAVIKQPKLTPLENPESLLRIVQDVITTVERGTSDFRWAFGMLANLSRHPENALLIGLTGIPRMAIDSLRVSQIPSRQWATNSLEDFSLYFLLHLAEASPQGLEGALEVIIPIMNGNDCPDKTTSNGDGGATSGDSGNENSSSNNNTNDSQAHRGGIQSLKATMICAFLGLEWKDFPDHGIIAAGTVSELMGNTFERVGKKQVYTDNDFALRTAVSAYAALARAAARADSGGAETPRASSGSCVHTKVMALPTSVALLFQIINAIALHFFEDNISGGSGNESYAEAYHWDIKAGDLAVGAIMSLLPALLEKTGGDNASTKHHPSMTTQYACADLSKVFVFFSKKTNSIAVRARSAEVAEKLTESASGSALPLLEASYDLCKNYGTHRLQQNFL